MNNCKFRVGDVVRINDKEGQGSTFSTYNTMAKKLKVKKWDRGNLPDYNCLYTIKDISYDAPHIGKEVNICYIENDFTGYGYLVEAKGFSLVEGYYEGKGKEFLNEAEFTIK